ncbi:2Fe-2S iron-sulfur cluster-binding protein [Hoeflea sp. CAU 1731]
MKITVTKRDGSTRMIRAEAGQILMEALRDNEIDDIEAICGGNCACGTCHVYIASEAFEEMPKPAEAEVDILECFDSAKPNSRLSCQVELTETMDGLCLEVAPQDTI